MRTYDPTDVKVVIDGDIITGFADGTFIQAEKDNETYSTHVGAQGQVSRTKNADPMGTLTLTIKQTSPSAKKLDKLAKSDDTFPSEVIDRNSNKVNAGGNTTWIEKIAPIERGNEENEQEWTIKVADYAQETV